MTKSEIKKQLNSYTKKQLVEALSDILSLNYDYIFYEIVEKINRNMFDNEKIRLNISQKEWETASANKINYLENLKEWLTYDYVFHVLYEKDYILPFIKKDIETKFGYELKYPTHKQIIFVKD